MRDLFLFAISVCLGVFFAVSACSEKSKDSGRQAAKPTTTPTSTVTPTVTPTNTVQPEESLEICLGKGLAWKPAIKDSTTGEIIPKHCVGELVTGWCCDRETILKRFTAQATDIKNTWDDPNKNFNQLRLYACSKASGMSASNIQKYEIHFAILNAGETQYRVINLDNLSMETGDTGKDASGNCPYPNPRYKTEGELFTSVSLYAPEEFMNHQEDSASGDFE